MSLADELAAFHEGRLNPAALIGEFRRTAVILPVVDLRISCVVSWPVRRSGKMVF